MIAVTGPIVRRIIEVSRGPGSPDELLASVGLGAVAPADPAHEVVAADAYYELLERCAAGDPELPFRYGQAVRPEDFGALGLALKTSRDVRNALELMIRYVLVITTTLEYELVEEDDGCAFLLRGRPPGRRPGISTANECALAAINALMQRIAAEPIGPALVTFRHEHPADVDPHRANFGCLVRFGAHADAVHFSGRTLATPTRLADDGLSSFLLAKLDEVHERAAERPVVMKVRSAIADALANGAPQKAEIARRLGMSERTLQRRLTEEGESFQALATQVRREVAESLLSTTRHSLSEVAFLTGFSDQSACQRAFKSWTGTTPLSFRQAAV
jgi:AraC-like DNA-binding protein